MATHSSILAWETPWTEESGGLQSMELQRVGVTEQQTLSLLWSKVYQFSSVQLLSCVRLFATPWTVAYQAPLSRVFSRQEYWNGLPFLSPGDQPRPLAFQADSLPSEPPGKFKKSWDHCFHQHGNKV